MGSDIPYPCVGELGQKRPWIFADVVGVDQVGYEVEKDDGGEAYRRPSSGAKVEESIEERHCCDVEDDGGLQCKCLPLWMLHWRAREEAHPGVFIEVEHGRHGRFLDAPIVGGPWG